MIFTITQPNFFHFLKKEGHKAIIFCHLAIRLGTIKKMKFILNRYRNIIICAFSILTQFLAQAQPVPGDIFRDYVWVTPEESAYQFLRVIGDGDYREPVTFSKVYPKECVEDGWVKFEKNVDLKNAVRAELQVEFLLSHDETSGFAVKVNNNNWHYFSLPEAIPEPKANYMQHHYPVVEIPLKEIKEGIENRIRFRVDSIQRFGMPQHILYGFRLRVYYDKTKKHAYARIGGVENGQILAETQNLELTEIKGKIKQVNYVALLNDVNFEGDGIYRQWHYTFYRGEIRNHIGTSTEKPFQKTWNTEWLPDQKQGIEISAFITDENNVTYFLPPVKNLKLLRNYSVELCTPFEIPENWVTREHEFEEKIYISGNPEEAKAFQLVFTSWSPGYLNGIFINDWLVPTSDDCHYCYGVHRIEIERPYFLKQGINSIKTGLTPLQFGKMVHGAEIIFPGMMLLVKYKNNAVKISEAEWKGQPHFKVEIQNSTWYIEKMSGGCSSIIDEEGRDWIDFKKTGDNPPLMSSDSDFRGVPNLVFQEPGNGIGHPGFDQCETTQVSENELLVKSKNNKWQFRWIFQANYAELKIERTDESRKYWFLYEGPSAGVFSPGNQYWGNNVDGIRTDCPSIYKNPQSGYWQWAFFGMKKINTSLFVAEKEKDETPDYFSYMGHDPIKQNLSADGMNVFGFGRGIKTNPELRGENHFFIGIFPLPLNKTENIKPFKNYISELLK